MSNKIVEGGTDGDGAAPDNKEMKGLVAAAAMMAGGGERDHTVENVMQKNTSSKVKTNNMTSSPGDGKTNYISAARARRLEQNRRAAVESRRRKKVMVEELMRSVSFYTKANETLRADNADMEQRLCLAKQRLAQMQMGKAPAALKLNAPLEKSHQTQIDKHRDELILKVSSEKSHRRMGVGAAPALLKAPPEGCDKLKALKKGSPSELLQKQNEQKQQPVFRLAPTISFPALSQSVSPDQAVAQLTVTQAMYESLGYPSAAARNAASTFSQFVGITGNTPRVKDANDSSVNPPDAGAATKTSAFEPIISKTAQLPSEAEVGHENFVASLKEVC